jgi:molybdate transport system substrate-binding protein
MTRRSFLSRAVALGLSGIFLLAGGAAQSAEIRVVSSGGFAAAYRALAPEFERQTGNTLVTHWGPSMGDTPQAVPARLARGEPIDVLIMVGYALDDLVKQGKVAADSRVALARSGIGVVVRQGAPRPDISTVDGLRKALLAAKSIAYSDSASGVYIQNEMFRRLGIAEQVAGKARMIPAEPVGAVVARGEAEIGFQQISELKPIKGIELVGPLPPEVQLYTVFSAGILADARQPQAARALIHFLASPAAAPAIEASGMEPMATAAAPVPAAAPQ